MGVGLVNVNISSMFKFSLYTTISNIKQVPKSFLQLKTELESMKNAVIKTHILTRARLQERIHMHVMKDINSEELLQQGVLHLYKTTLYSNVIKRLVLLFSSLHIML